MFKPEIFINAFSSSRVDTSVCKYFFPSFPSPNLNMTTISQPRHRFEHATYRRGITVLSARSLKALVSAFELINFELPSMMMIYCWEISFETHCDVIKCGKSAEEVREAMREELKILISKP